MKFLDNVKNNSLMQEFVDHEKHYFVEETTSQKIYYFLGASGKKFIAIYRGKRGADNIWLYMPVTNESKLKKLLDGKVSIIDYNKNKDYYLSYIKNGKLRNIRKLKLMEIPKTYQPNEKENLEINNDKQET